MDSLSSLFGDPRFMPHGHCFLWFPAILWTNVIADALIAAAYLSIPATLVYIIRRRRDLPFDWMFGAFGVFILACGTTHVLEIWTLWHPDYWLTAAVKVITAVASVVTAVLLVRLVPAALAIPSPSQLARVNAELRGAQAALVTAARQAGMAEVAINVLHNVGNVLNSVNVSADLLGRQIHASRTQVLPQVVELLRAHGGEAHFLSEHEKGRLLPDYLAGVAVALADERQQMLDELSNLKKSVEHIKEIVANQQAYASAPAVIEACLIGELLADAWRMSADAQSYQDIEMRMELQDVPPLALDKHQLLQVLLNLIRNARQALAAAPASKRQITLRLARPAPGRVEVQVADNGEGIAPDDLKRVFVHGFTTRADGHGFGLHSCALAAKAMGGSLRAQSAGRGLGATFTLELPIDAGRPAPAP